MYFLAHSDLNSSRVILYFDPYYTNVKGVMGYSVTRERCGAKDNVVTRIERVKLQWFDHIQRMSTKVT